MAEDHSLHWNCRLFFPQFVIEESEENGDRSLLETLFDLMKHHFEIEEGKQLCNLVYQINLAPKGNWVYGFIIALNFGFLLSRNLQVMVIRGKDKGKTGVVKRVVRSQMCVIVEGKNLVKKHIKQGQGHEGGIFTVEAPLHVSNVQVIDPVTGKPCKVGIKYLEDGTKVRVSRGLSASGSIIPLPEILKIRTTPRPIVGTYSNILRSSFSFSL
ncbi:uncharacterized protein LOC133784919 [Humulus lupulus]|uniref:uncharacterized protein LOC133784919 n=1 Tax=Humulus lupulus TaxID=3486 RepID=UPI002B40DB51|nr:uncharacterized protein LOC133784919 [Humulus lupulus]